MTQSQRSVIIVAPSVPCIILFAVNVQRHQYKKYKRLNDKVKVKKINKIY